MCCDLKPCPGKPELVEERELVVSPDGRICLPEDGISIMEVEKELIRQALERFRGNQTKAARFLGMTRDSLRYRMKKYELR
jgi:DNA-binding NtrC family response regulator